MGPAKRKIESKEENPQAFNIDDFQKKARHLATLHGVDALLLVFLPLKTSTDLNSGCNRGLNPPSRPDPNQEHRRVSKIDELADLDKTLEKVRARIRFLESVRKQNAENSSHQEGDLSSPAPTVAGDAAATDQR